MNSNWSLDDNRLNVNGNNWNDNRNGYAFGIALAPKTNAMKCYKQIYGEIISFENLILAWKKARKGKTTKKYVIEFEKELFYNLLALHYELKFEAYKPKPLQAFVIRDPKTRKIHKSDFRDRIVHHAIVNVIEPIFERIFIYDSYANRVGKGALKAVQRLDSFIEKVSRNGRISGWFSNNQVKGYCLKADIKHYFKNIDHEILISFLSRKIADEKALGLIRTIVANSDTQRERESNCLGHAFRQPNLAVFR